ncbi:hypothetical protein C4K38_3703 [Pseudomonas chlororaphis subsp. piscium]|nr:hypothetical protein C4K38_3703 [Pseudomonas chlororaphis subsp. piscium]
MLTNGTAPNGQPCVSSNRAFLPVRQVEASLAVPPNSTRNRGKALL